MMAFLCLWVTFLVELLMLVNPGSSVAPGDEEPLCEQLRALGFAPIPAYSTNIRVLMDSWNYQNLLPERTGAVWEQVDNDVNNPSGVTTYWIQQSNTPCQQSVQVCEFTAGPQNNWLITQLINRTVSGTRLSQVSVLIEIGLQDCDTTLNCQRTFNTHIYETSSEDSAERRNLTNYQQLERVSPDINDGSRVNVTVTFSFSTDHSSFYFAIQDETSCIVITRLIVFYHSQTDNDQKQTQTARTAEAIRVIQGGDVGQCPSEEERERARNELHQFAASEIANYTAASTTAMPPP